MLVGHGWLQVLWLQILALNGLSLAPGRNMGLEIVAIHPNSGETWRRPMKRRHSRPMIVVTGLDPGGSKTLAVRIFLLQKTRSPAAACVPDRRRIHGDILAPARRR